MMSPSHAQKVATYKEYQARLVVKARRSLKHFIAATMLNYEFNWHHLELCLALSQWLRGDIKNLIVSMPPRHGKSQIASKHLPAFIFGLNPNAEIMAASYSKDLASKNNRAVQRIMDLPIYREIFPNTMLRQVGGIHASSDAKRTSEEFEIVGHRGSYRSAGVGGGFTGMGASHLLIDDPFKNDEEANSETHRESIWEWWLSTALTRVQEDSKILLIQTRWHENDLAGRLLEQAKSDPTALQWNEITFEAIREDMSNPRDPRVMGEPLWPQRFNLSRLETLRSSLGPRWWNSLYQQRPTALEGGIIKKSWIKYYTELPPRFTNYIQSWDLTFKDTSTSAFVVGQVWGVYGRHKYLLDQVRDRWGFTETVAQIKSLSEKWPKARRKLIEDKANGPAVIETLRNQGISGVVPVPVHGSKDERLSAVSTDFLAGDVLLPHPSIAPWVNLVVDELVKFPNARYADICDTTSQALYDLGDGQTVLDKITRM